MIPALLTRTSSRPKRSRVTWTASAARSGSVMSASMTSAVPPAAAMSSASSSSRSRRRATIATAAPSRASRRAVAAPIPLLGAGHERHRTSQSVVRHDLAPTTRASLRTAARSRPARAPCTPRTSAGQSASSWPMRVSCSPCAAAARRRAPARSSVDAKAGRGRVDPARQPGRHLLQHPAVAVRVAERQERAVAAAVRVRAGHRGLRSRRGGRRRRRRGTPRWPRHRAAPARRARPRCRRRSGAAPAPSPAPET